MQGQKIRLAFQSLIVVAILLFFCIAISNTQAWALPADYLFLAQSNTQTALFDFETGNQGWVIAQYAQGYSHLTVSNHLHGPVHDGTSALQLDLSLREELSSSEILVDFATDPPPSLDISNNTANLEGKIINARIWAPSGTRGDSGSPNGWHLFVEDAAERRLYGTWQNLREGGWSQVSLEITNATPACGSLDSGFDPTQIRKIGFNVSLGSSETASLAGAIFLDSVTLTEPQLPQSDHLYTFDALSDNNGFPRWRAFPDEFGANALTQIGIQNGVLVADAHFVIPTEDNHENEDASNLDASRKGFIGLIHSPALNIANKDHAVFSLDIRFSPSAISSNHGCPFVISLWVFDESQGLWFQSDPQNVGATEWDRVSFNLADPIQYDPTATKTIGKHPDLSRIRRIGVQLFANRDYEGTVWIDNVAIGGIERPSLINEPPHDFVTVDGPHFKLNGQRFRFVGANAEYLFLVPKEVLTDVLDRAQAMGITVIRTWGFGDGCESEELQPCEDWSRYFQPAPGAWNENAFRHFDRVVAEASRRNIRLIVPLVNNWDEYGGIPQYVRWFEELHPEQALNLGNTSADQWHDQFYTNEQIKQWYQDYVRHFISRTNTITGIPYAQDPTIMAWELINEPRTRSDPSGATLHQWIIDMSKFVSELAPNHLVGTAEEGWYIMPQVEADLVADWQLFPKNYWHYGVNWQEKECYWGSNGADFLSDHSSLPRNVSWQERVGKTGITPVQSQLRYAVPNVHYTTAHVYVGPGETNLPWAPYCTYYGVNHLCALFDSSDHQAREWLSQHVEQAHNDLEKPFILEEFGFRILPGSGLLTEQFDDYAFYVSPEERTRLFTQYLDIAYELDIDGVLFWNLGYEGFLEQPWVEQPALRNWKPVLDSDSVTVITETNTLDDEQIGHRLDYAPTRGYGEAKITLSDFEVDWLRANNNRIMIDIDNLGDAQTVSFVFKLADGSIREAGSFQLSAGQSSIALNSILKQPEEPRAEDNCPQSKAEPPLVTEIILSLQGYTVPGAIFFNFRSIFDNSYVLYPGDPTEQVIRAATFRWGNNDPFLPSTISLDHTQTCGQTIGVTKQVTIELEYRGGLEHPEGVFYRYKADTPAGVGETQFGLIIPDEKHGQIYFTPQSPGLHSVHVAPEGTSFDSPLADSCNFLVTTTPRKILTLNHTLTCGQEVALDTVQVSFEFQVQDKLAVPGGIVYQYLVDQPGIADEPALGQLRANEQGGTFTFSPQNPGQHLVSIAPVGEPIDGPASDSCMFIVQSQPPEIERIKVNDLTITPPFEQQVQPPTTRLTHLRQEIQITMIAEDDVTDKLQTGCLLQGSTALVACRVSGENSFLADMLPGVYQLHIWAEDGELQRTEVSIPVYIPAPIVVYIILISPIIAVALYFILARARNHHTK